MAIQAVTRLSVAASTTISAAGSGVTVAAPSYAVSASASSNSYMTAVEVIKSRVTAGSTITSSVSAQTAAGAFTGGGLLSQICSAVNSATAKVI